MDLKRTYEVSLWSLQDEFITVLKPLNVENIGQLESKELQLQTDDGLNQYSCSIPMYLYRGAERIVNPIWYNTTNGNIIANMRKIKVILNKGAIDDDGNSIERVYEFLIVKVEERHEKDQLFCDITCEDLAYNELGKVGYKISLSSDKFLDEYNKWCESPGSEPKPEATLQYWCNQFLAPAPAEGELVNPNKWYYSVEMNWNAYSDALDRAPDKVYEEGYTSGWIMDDENQQLIPKSEEKYQEKARLIDAEESNTFNLTQELAEKFEIFVRYEYSYDDNYHITGRRIIFYNNYLREEDGYLDITYPYHAALIKREIDGNDITTKMFVRPVDEDTSDSGLITIMDVEANRSKEDYLLNFEYMREIGAITAEQYAEIPKYEYKMRGYNNDLHTLSSVLSVLADEENNLKARQTVLENAIALDKERQNDAMDVLNNLARKDLTIDSTFDITENSPRSAILIPQNDGSDKYYINLSESGIMRETLRIFGKYAWVSGTDTKKVELSLEMEGTFVDDDFGDLIQVRDISKPSEKKDGQVYLTYSYRPALKYELVRKTWAIREAKDEAELEGVNAQLEEMAEVIAAKTDEYDTLLAQKHEEIARFEQMMGPALRESYWQPEDYKTTGDSYIDSFPPSSGESGFTKFIWDDQLFDEEDKGYYEVSANQVKTYYPCIQLSQAQLQMVLANKDKISFMFYDYIATEERPSEKNLRHWALGSQMKLAYVKNGNNVVPVLMLTGAETASAFTVRNMINRQTRQGDPISPIVGILDIDTTGDIINYTIRDSFSPTWYNLKKDNNNKVSITVTWTDSEDQEHTETFSNLDTDAAEFDRWVEKLTEINFNDTQTVITSVDAALWTEVVTCYPRIQINSMLLKDDESLVLKCDNELADKFSDYYLLTRTECENKNAPLEDQIYNSYYYITIKPEAYPLNEQLELSFTLSNANTAIYLDAIQVLKENSMPKVTYTIEPSFINRDFHYRLYQQLNRIVNINDLDLKLENVQGYISGLTLDLDVPFNDKIEIKNYRNKFEDLFSNIVAQTEAMKKNAFTVGLAAAAFTSSGILAPAVIQQSINRADLNYAFNQGSLTIDEANGIWATSDDGVVAMRGGGIFTATEKDSEDNWIWNTGILPGGINANLITTGQLDTNLIRIYAGDQLKFQMNGDGLFAYKSIFDDPQLLEILYSLDGYDDAAQKQEIINKLESNGGLELTQYVVHNAEGLFLTAEAGSVIKTNDNKLKLVDTDVNRVEISWDGLILRDWNNEPTLYADADTGDLTVRGNIEAASLVIASGEDEEGHIIWEPIETYAGVKNITVQYQQTSHEDRTELIENNWVPSINDVDNTKYLWSRTKTEISGQDPRYTEPICIAFPSVDVTTLALISLDGPQYFVKNGDNYNPTSITLTATAQNCNIAGWYIDSSDEPYKEHETDEEPYTGDTFDLSPGEWELKTITVKADNGLQDTRSVAILIKGSDGESNIVAYLTNNNVSFLADTAGALVDNTTIPISLYVYEGTTPITDYSVDIDGGIIGELTYSISDNVITIQAYAGATLNNNNNGVLTFTISRANEEIAHTQLNWSKVFTGRGIASVNEYYAATADSDTTPTGTGSTTIPDTYGPNNPILWNREVINYTDDTSSTSTDWAIIGVYGKDGDDGRSITRVVNYYLTTNESSGITQTTPGWSTTITPVSATAKYLWNYEEVQYDSGNPDKTEPCIIGNYAESGTSPTLYEIVVSDSVIVESEEHTYSPSFITLSALYQVGSGVRQEYTNGYYSVENISTGSTITPDSNGHYVVPANTTGLQCYLYTDAAKTQLVDQQTIPVLSEGAQGPAGTPGYTVLLTNESHVFPGEVNTAVNGASTTSEILVFKGAQRTYDYTVGTVNPPEGVSFTWEANATNKIFKVTVSDTVTTGGIITIPITLNDGLVINKTFTYSISFKGQEGEPADQLLSVEQEYYLSTSNQSPQGGTWSTSMPEYLAGRYYWTRSKMTWDRTENPITYTEPVLAEGLNELNSKTNQALQTAQDAATAIAPIITNGLSSGEWNGVDYGLILGNTSTSKPMLIGSNSGITIAADADEDDGAAMSLSKDGIGMYGTSINFKAEEDDASSTVIINPGGITLNTGGDFTVNSGGNIVLDGGTFSVDSGNFAIDADGNVSMAGTITATDGAIGGWNIQEHQLDSGSNTTFVALNSNPNNTYAIWAGSETAANAPFKVERDGSVIATDGQIGGWYLDTNRLYSGNDSDNTYVGLDSDPNSVYAIWAGDETPADAPFRVKRDGTVYLTKLKALDEHGAETNVNLNNYPFWKLNTDFIRTAAVDGNTLTLTYFSGASVNFSKANVYDHSTVNYEELTAGGRVEIGIFDTEDNSIITAYVTLTKHNNDHTLNIIATADGQSDTGVIDLTSWWKNGWRDAYNQIVTPAGGGSTSLAQITLPNETPGGDPVNNGITLRLNDRDPKTATVTMHWRGSMQIASIDVYSLFTSVDFDNTGSWSSSGTRTITLTNDKTATISMPALDRIVGSYDSTNNEYNITTRFSGGYAVTGTISANTAWNNGYNSVTSSWDGNWSGGSTTVYVDPTRNGVSRSITVTMPTSATITGTLATDTSYTITCIAGGKTYTETIDTTDSFNAGFNSVTLSEGAWSSGTKRISASNGEYKDVTVSLTGGSWAAGTFTVSGSNGTSYPVAAPTIPSESVARYSDGSYTVTVNVGGSIQTTSHSGTLAYNAGWGAAVGSRSGNTVTYASSTVGTMKSETAKVYNGGSVFIPPSVATVLGCSSGTWYKDLSVGWE